MDHVCEEGREVELPGRQPFDDAHGGATARTRPRRPRRGGDGRVGWWRRRREHRATRGEVLGATAGGEQAKVADPDEALRQDVQEKAPQEFLNLDRQGADLTAVPIVLPPKLDGVLGYGDEPVVGDGDPMGVPRQVVQHVRGTPEGRFRVHDPRLLMQGPEPGSKRGVGGERL